MCAQRRLKWAWASAQSDQSSLCAQWVAKNRSFLHADSEDSDQTGRMVRLICVFAGRTCHFVGFVVTRLIWCWEVTGKQGYDLELPLWNEPPHDKTNKMTVRPAKTQISLGIRPVRSESLLSAWRKLGSLATHWAHSEDSDQTGRMPRLIWVFAGRTVILLVLSWGTNSEWVRISRLLLIIHQSAASFWSQHYYFGGWNSYFHLHSTNGTTSKSIKPYL